MSHHIMFVFGMSACVLYECVYLFMIFAFITDLILLCPRLFAGTRCVFRSLVHIKFNLFTQNHTKSLLDQVWAGCGRSAKPGRPSLM